MLQRNTFLGRIASMQASAVDRAGRRRAITARTRVCLLTLLCASSTGLSAGDVGWQSVAPMLQARAGHAMVALPPGPNALGISDRAAAVMVIGGFDSSPFGAPTVPGTPLSSCEIYDRDSNTWIPTAPLPDAGGWRWSAVLANGMVLVAGGATDLVHFLSSSYLFDPKKNRWVKTGALPKATANPEANMRAVTLPNGQVLIAGGVDASSFASSFLPDPIRASYVFTLNEKNPNASKWSATRSTVTGKITEMPAGRSSSALVRLANGRVLNAGGIGPLIDGQFAATNTAIEYDYLTGEWISIASMPAVFGVQEDELVLAYANYPTAPGSRLTPASAELPDGRVLLAGGIAGFLSDPNEPMRRSAIIFDPTTGAWSIAAPMKYYRPGALTASLPRDGDMLVVGPGYYESTPSAPFVPHDAAGEIYDLNSNSWRPAPQNNGPPADGSFDSYMSKMVLRADSAVQVAGGVDQDTGLYANSASWVYVEP